MAPESYEMLPLPRGWPKFVRSALLHVVALAQMALTYSRSWAADSPLARVRLRAVLDAAQSEVAMLTEELRIKDCRLARIDPRGRPHYPPEERLAILALRAARGWSSAETSRRMFVEPKTIASWMGRLDEEGPDALVQTAGPVNRFPEFVREAVALLKRACPTMGKRRIAQELARAGLHLAVNTVRRMLRRERPNTPRPSQISATPPKSKAITARGPNDVWQVDLTLLPRVSGLWVPWFPSVLPPCWPFVWWAAVAVDHFSRRVMGWCVFARTPTSAEMRAFLGRAMHVAGAVPRHLVSDKGGQFFCAGYKAWCRGKGIRPRYAAAGSIRATAIVERFFRSLKTEMTSIIGTTLTRAALQKKLAMYFHWFEEHRPHQGLGGRTPREVFCGLAPANEAPRYEPRPGWPRRSSCARPLARPKEDPGGELELLVEFLDEEKQLPIVTLRRVA